MTKTYSAAEAITAIFFDPVAEATAQPSVRDILFGKKPAAAPIASPRYRSIDEAVTELQARGLSAEVARYIRNCIDTVVTNAVLDEVHTSGGTFTRKDVAWNNGDAYLGVRFVNPAVDNLATGRPDMVAAMRANFLGNMTELLSRKTRVSVELPVNMPARLVAA